MARNSFLHGEVSVDKISTHERSFVSTEQLTQTRKGHFVSTEQKTQQRKVAKDSAKKSSS